MTALTTPIYIGTVNGHSVRFFRSPSGQPEMPWHAFEDLTQALDLPRQMRKLLFRFAREQFGKELRTVATPNGLVTIAPHYAAQGLIGAAIQAGSFGEQLETEYAMAGGEALSVLTAGMPFEAVISYSTKAFKNTFGEGDAQ